jgi:hypothetical protein
VILYYPCIGNGNIHDSQQQKLESNFSFVAAEDCGYDERAQRTVENIQNKTPDLILALGGLSYQKDADCWLAIMKPLINRGSLFHYKVLINS